MKILVGTGDRRETDLDRLHVPMSPRVEISVQDFVGFISEYASNISKGGMFIGTETPHPTGTEIEFDIHLEEDKFSLIRGRGVVVWVVRPPAAGRLEPGMGVRFSSLEGDSLSLIERIVDNYVAEGGSPFELERAAPLGAASLPEAAPPAAEPSPLPRVSSEPAGAESENRALRPPEPRPDEPRGDEQPAAAEDDEARRAVRSLGESHRAFAPGMESPATLQDQEERARAPKPSLPGVDPEAPAAGDAGEQAPTASPGRTSLEGTTPAPVSSPEPRLPSTPAAGEEESPPRPEQPPPSEEPGPPTEVPPSDGPSLEPGGGLELSLDEDDDFSIDFDTTNSLESEKAAAAADEAAASTPDAMAASAREESGSFTAAFGEDEPAAVPDLSETLGQDMVGAGTGFFEAMSLESEGETDEEPALPEPVEPDEPSRWDEPSSGSSAVEEDLPDLGDPSSLEELVGELQAGETEAEGSADARFEPAVEDLELEALASLDSEIAEEEVREPVAEARTEEKSSSPPVEAPPIQHFAVPELESTASYATRPPKRRRLRPGQLRRWTILLVLLGAVGSGIYFVREKGVEMFLGPGSDFSLVAEPLAESEELGEIEPSTLLELMQQEQTQVEIEELNGTRQRQVRPLSVIENVTWRETDRTTILTLWGNGDFAPSSTAWVRLDGETSREVLQIRGVQEPYWARTVGVGTGVVDRLRFGYRERKPFNEVHLAIDLVRSQARVRRIELDGRRLHVYVR